MAKAGFKYYTSDTEKYNDIKIKRLKKKYRCDGVAVYDYILCEIYKSNGYYIEKTNDMVFSIADYFCLEEDYVEEIISYCTDIQLFDSAILAFQNILTSKDIQERFLTIVKKNNSRIDDKLNLISTIPTTVKTDSHPDDKAGFATVAGSTTTTSENNDSIPTTYLQQTTLDFHSIVLGESVAAMKTDEIWQEQVMINNSLDKNQLIELIDKFQSQCIANGKTSHSSVGDAKKHFNAWLRIIRQLENNSNNSDNSKINNHDRAPTNRLNKRRGVILHADEAKVYEGTF